MTLIKHKFINFYYFLNIKIQIFINKNLNSTYLSIFIIQFQGLIIFNKMQRQIRITVSKEINQLLESFAKKLGKKKSTLARELMEQKMYDLEIIQRGLRDL